LGLWLLQKFSVWQTRGSGIGGDADLSIDNNWVENRIRPIAQGRQN